MRIGDKVRATVIGCYFKSDCVSVFLYAGDILLTAPSLNVLQTSLNVDPKQTVLYLSKSCLLTYVCVIVFISLVVNLFVFFGLFVCFLNACF